MDVLPALTLERVESRSSAEWEIFLDGETDGTLFHRLSFLAYHPEGRFRSHHLAGRRDGNLIAVIPLAEGVGDAEGLLVSPYGGSFGGFAAAASVELPDHLALLDRLCDYARDRGLTGLRIASRPAPYRPFGEGAESALAVRGARVVRREVTQIAPLGGTDGELMERIGGTARRGARKAERLGTEVREGTASDLGAFHDLLVADRARLESAPTHTRADLDVLTRDRPDDYRVLFAENGKELVGGILLFRASARVAVSFYTARSESPRAERCMNLLMEHALKTSRAWGCTFLDYGTSSIGGELNEGLAHFKERFGGLSYLRETWQLDV